MTHPTADDNVDAAGPSPESEFAEAGGVVDPELGDNIVELGMVKRLERSPDRNIHITIALTTAGCPLRAELTRDAKARVGPLPDIDVAKIHFGEMTADERRNVMARTRWKARDNALDADVGGYSMLQLLGIDSEIEGQAASEGQAVGHLDVRLRRRTAARRHHRRAASRVHPARHSCGRDAGTPVAMESPDTAVSVAYRDLANIVVTDVAPPIEIAECSLRGTLVRAGADLASSRQRAQAR